MKNKTPGRLEITTRIGCKMNCVYCPQKLLTTNYFKVNPFRRAVLSLEDFKKCLEKIPVGTRIDFSGMAEPWLNEQCTDMVCYAADEGFPIAIYTTLVGMSLKDFERIKDLDFDEFVLHVPDDKSNANIQITEEYLSLLYQVTGHKKKGLPLVTGYSCHAGIHPDIVETIPKNSKLITELISRAGNVENDYVESKHSTGEIVCINCGTGMNHNVLLPDGTIVLCCMDYALEHVLGNLLEKSYEEILDSPEAKRIQKEMQKDEVDILCRNCTNARSVQELYEDYHLYWDWCRKLQKSENLKDYDLLKYREWVDNLNDAKEKEQKTYQQWVDNLQKQECDLKEQICHLEIAYEERIKELKDYQQWVENLQTQEVRLKENLEKSETELLDLREKLTVLTESQKELTAEKEELLKYLEIIQDWKGYRVFSWLNKKQKGHQ